MKWLTYGGFTVSLLGFAAAASNGHFSWWSGILGFGGLAVAVATALAVCGRNRDFPRGPF